MTCWRSSPFLYVPNIIGYARLVLVLVGLQLALPGSAGETRAAGGPSAAGTIRGLTTGIGLGDGLYWSMVKVFRNFAMRWIRGGALDAEPAGALTPAGGIDHVALGMFLYCTGFLLDGLDGHAARYLKQESTMGKVLDMVTDRISTGGLLFVVALYVPSLTSFFIAVFWLDIAAHWYHMYSTVISESAHSSHKVIAGGENTDGVLSKALKLYYHYKLVFVSCILANELVWIILILRLGSPSFQISSPASSLTSALSMFPTTIPASVHSVASALRLGGIVGDVQMRLSEYVAGMQAAAGAFDGYIYYNSWTCVVDAIFLVCLPLWAVKQLTNVAMLVRGASACNAFDDDTKSRHQ